MTKNKSRVNSCKNPFEVELLREKLALVDDRRNFLSQYKKGVCEIKNNNSDRLWDSVLDRKSMDQDNMTKDRIKKTSRLMDARGEKIEILDIGIGDGWVEKEVLKKNENIYITGVDIAENNLIKLSKQFNNFTAHVGNLENLTEQDINNKFDYILALEVFEHISPTKIINSQKKLKKFLKPNGKLIVSVPTNEDLEEKINEGKNYSQHVRRYTQNIIRYELKCSGYKILKEINLFAFSTNYRLKTVISKIFKVRKPNITILLCEG